MKVPQCSHFYEYIKINQRNTTEPLSPTRRYKTSWAMATMAWHSPHALKALLREESHPPECS
jgi:hypothetical protein